MERLSDYLVFCDMDNTLLTAKEGIPACNRSVIRLFTAMGGRFTVASGRPPESIRAALGDIELSLPAISCNGSLLYDFQANRVLRRSCLNQEQAAAAIADMLQKFPKIGVEVMAGAGRCMLFTPAAIPTPTRWMNTWKAWPARWKMCRMAG